MQRDGSAPTWSDLHGGGGAAGAALSIGHLQPEQVGPLDQVGQVERRLRVRVVQNILELQPATPVSPMSRSPDPDGSGRQL